MFDGGTLVYLVHESLAWLCSSVSCKLLLRLKFSIVHGWVLCLSPLQPRVYCSSSRQNRASQWAASSATNQVFPVFSCR